MNVHTPWNQRTASADERLRFRDLVDLNELTLQWLRELHKESQVITRGLSASLADELWMLESLKDTSIDSLLDDTRAEDLLGRMHQSIWSIQGWTLEHLIERASKTERVMLDSHLEQIAWKLGRQTGEARFGKMITAAGPLPLERLPLALWHTPLSGQPRGEGFLVVRAVASEILLELRDCPHRSPYPEVQAVADALCRHHSHWLRGYAYALNHRFAVQLEIGKPRCTHRWSLMRSQEV